jgi:hypothetical protein
MNSNKQKKLYAISQLVRPVDCKYGAPMGRFSNSIGDKPKNMKIYDRKVPMDKYDAAYDKGGAYWGLGAQLRVEYTKGLTYARFYRVDE